MQHELELTVALLARTPPALDALLRGLPEAWLDKNEGGETWTVSEVMGHLIHCEHVDWVPRARLILAESQKSFAPFDRFGHLAARGSRTTDDLLGEFAEIRAANLVWLRSLDLQAADFERRGIHPAFGPVTLAQLLATWAVHDMTHLSQISRVMAFQYRDAVGPWREYLGVLKERASDR